MRKLINLWLMAALVCGLSLSLASCKDDDDNDNGDGSRNEQLTGQSEDFWAVVGQLVGMTNATDDYQTKTFEPIIGEPTADNATVRRVMVNTMKSAVERFESLIGLDEGTLDTITTSYTWKNDAVGTMTYNKSTDGHSLATVDVNIKQVPGLRQIVFLSPEQLGTNSSEKDWHNCYYHFGDVIKRRTDEGVIEYWICVRPSFDPEGKKKSYWATLSPLSHNNIAIYGDASNKKHYTIPTKLGQDDNQMENLAEMLYAMLFPDEWETNINENPGGFFSSGIEMFQDFDKKKIKYVSTDFWRRVHRGWTETEVDGKNLWQIIFAENEPEFRSRLGGSGLHLLYNGYSWLWSVSNTLSLYEQVFTPDGVGTKANMHNRKKRTISHEVINKRNPADDILVSVLSQYTADHPYFDNETLVSENGNQHFFGDKDNCRHYIFRFATGEELAKQNGAAYDKKTPMSNFEDIYVYTKMYNLDLNRGCETSQEIKTGQPEPVEGKAHSLKDIGLEFDATLLSDVYSTTSDVLSLNLSTSWRNGAQKRNVTLYAFVENNLTGVKTACGSFDINTWSSLGYVAPELSGVAVGDYTLLVTDNSQGKDPCVFTKKFSVADPQFTIQWQGVENQVMPSKELLEGTLRMTIQNFDELQIDYLYLVQKDVTTGKSEIRKSFNFPRFEKNKAENLQFSYIINQQHDYTLILCTDGEGKKPLAQIDVKGVVTSKNMNDVTAADLYSIIGGDGKVYPTVVAANAAGSYALAMIVLTPWKNAEDNMSVNFCDDKQSPYYDTAKTAKEIEDALGLIHGMAIPMTEPRVDMPEGIEIYKRTYDEALSSLKRWNISGESDMYLRGHNWQLPSAYLITRMMNEILSHSVLNRQNMDSPNLYCWKSLKLKDPTTQNSSALNNYCNVDTYRYFIQNIVTKGDEIHTPLTCWLKEVVEFNGKQYPLALCYDLRYPSNDTSAPSFYYYPTEKDHEMGFMPVILW